MKKVFTLAVGLLLAAAILTGCAGSTDYPAYYFNRFNIADETVVYSYMVKKGDEVWTTDASELTYTLTTVDENLVKLSMRLSLTYNDKKPALDNLTYDGVSDLVESEVVFYARLKEGEAESGLPLRPMSVKKTYTLGHPSEAEDSYGYEYTYPTKEKEAGKGFYLKGEDKTNFEIKYKRTSGVFDNEQLFYLVGASLYKYNATEKGSPTSFKVINPSASSSDGFTMGFTAGDAVSQYAPFATDSTNLGSYVAKTTGADILPVTVGVAGGNTGYRGGFFSAHYLTKSAVTLNDEALTLRNYLLLGYKQEILNMTGTAEYTNYCLLKSFSQA